MGRRGGRAVRAAALLGLVALLAACSPTVSSDSTGADRAAAAKAATKDLEAAENQDLGCANIVTSRDRRATPAPEHLVLLVDAYAVPEPCWDRIVFTFDPTGDNVPPGYQIEYKEGPFVEGPTNAPVGTVGEQFLLITFTPASQTDTRDPGRPKQTYKGNLLLRLEEMNHTQLVRKLIDGEDGTQSWLIGLDTKRPFTVDASSNPPRVTVLVMK